MFKSFNLFWKNLKKRWAYGVLSAIVAVGITLTYQSPSYSFGLQDILRGVQIIQLSTLSDRQEVAIGEQIDRQLIDSGRIRIYRNRQLNRYVNSIGQELARSSDRPDIPYTFQIVDDNSVNAFATMGGFVYVNTGLMKLADNEAELAGVIAHEIGHVAGRHAVKQMRERAITQGALSAAGLDRSTAVQLGVQLAVGLPHSRGDEFDADNRGLRTLARSGYAPIGLVDFMRKLEAAGGRSRPSFLSTHPASGDRVVAMQQQLDRDRANVGRGLDDRAYQNIIRRYLR
ncbi:MAG: M48 family metallopeptidase [Prochloraceae cyanobacterium]